LICGKRKLHYFRISRKQSHGLLLSEVLEAMKLKRFGYSFLFGLLLAALSSAGARAAGLNATCTPNFPLQTGLQQGWLGADAAYSIPLSNGRDLWIFGDTLDGAQRIVHGNDPEMVRNSIGVSTCTAGRWKIRYVIRRDEQGKLVDFFHARHPHTWYWALDGFRVGADVWVTLLCVRASEAKSAMGFETCGSDLARISSIGPDPQRWKVDYFPLVADGAHAYPSATTVIDGDHADVFALDEKRSKPLIAARIPLSGLGDPKANLEYLDRDAKWVFATRGADYGLCGVERGFCDDQCDRSGQWG